jgi:hypothetical protein
MNSTLKRIAILALLATPVFGQHARFSIDRYKPEFSQDALMCLWSFNQGAALDLSPHEFPLTEVSSPTYTNRSVVLTGGSYLTFDEHDGTLRFDANNNYVYGDFSISGWATWTADANGAVVNIWRSGSMDIGIGLWASVDNVYGITYPRPNAISTVTRPLDVLVHYVVTWDGTTLRLYENGVAYTGAASSYVPRFHIPYYKTTILSMIGKFHTYAGEINIHSHIRYYGNCRTAAQVMKEHQEGPHR